MDIEEIIKIGFAIVVALLYYMFKSKPNTEAPSDQPARMNPPNPTTNLGGAANKKREVVEKIVSFDDILKKFQVAEPEQNPSLLSAAPIEEIEKISADKLKKQIHQKIKLTGREVSLDQSSFNKGIIPLKEQRKQYVKSQEQKITEGPKNPPQEEEKFKAYKDKTEPIHPLTKILHNPENLTQSFIVSEVFKRKYE